MERYNKLSELKENVIYKYIADSTIQFPKIENDVEKNCIIYLKEKDDKNYEKKISVYKEISSSNISASFNEYNLGDTFCIMYKVIEKDELLDLIKKDEIIYLSNYKDGDKLKYEFEKYIYNDTKKDIMISIKDKLLGSESSKTFTIEKGEICKFDWKIDSASINYLSNNGEDKNEKVEKKIIYLKII